MRFEERELKPYAEPVSAGDLKEGEVYFAVNYVDDNMLIPTLETLVFVGRNLDPNDVETDVRKVYFQDVESYLRGIRRNSPSDGDQAMFSCGPESQVSHIFKYEHALDELMRCALRRRKVPSV
jgi:hypothetical protein